MRKLANFMIRVPVFFSRFGEEVRLDNNGPNVVLYLHCVPEPILFSPLKSNRFMLLNMEP